MSKKEKILLVDTGLLSKATFEKLKEMGNDVELVDINNVPKLSSEYEDKAMPIYNTYLPYMDNKKEWNCQGLHRYTKQEYGGETIWICQCGTKL